MAERQRCKMMDVRRDGGKRRVKGRKRERMEERDTRGK